MHEFVETVIRSCSILFCFFFQAEDGIRDLIVTGVQTCALPISWRAGSSGSALGLPSSRSLASRQHTLPVQSHSSAPRFQTYTYPTAKMNMNTSISTDRKSVV